VSALVVFDSATGRTESIARAIAEALHATPGGARARRVIELERSALAGVTLLIVGSPTHGGSPSALVRAYLGDLRGGALDGVAVAAFETAVDPAALTPFARLFAGAAGRAAQRIEERLLLAGGESAGDRARFLISAPRGTLAPGESDRARAWANSLRLPPTQVG
jgi:flavodoxin